MALKRQNSGLQVHVKEGDSPAIIELLEDTILGTPGKLRYQRRGAVERIRSHEHIEFIQITKRDRVLGTAGVIKRSTRHQSKPLEALYIRYLSVRNPFGKNKKRTPESNNRSKKRRTALRDRIAGVINEHFEQPYIEDDSKAAFYAYVEAENENSRALCMSLGFLPKRSVHTFLFSRFFPGSSRQVRRMHQSEQKEIISQLRAFYSDYSFYFEEGVFSEGSYYIFEENGRPVAGLRAQPVEWEIIDIPGWKGFLMQKVLPYLPLTRRHFDIGRFRFLSFDYIWHLPGHKEKVIRVMEHALAEHQHYTGMCWVDADTDLSTFFRESASMGMLHLINGVVSADLMLRTIYFSKEEKKELINAPVFVSAADMT